MPNHNRAKQASRPACPSCGSSLAVVRVAYGAHSYDTAEHINRHPVEPDLSGTMHEEAPHWFCEECQTHFGKVTDAA